jgi:ATP phosphoribosyltransferase
VTPRSSVPTGVLTLAGEALHRQREAEGRCIEPLAGSAELAARLGLAQTVLDLVETGYTLRENGLHPVEDWLKVAPYLIANRAASFRRGDEFRTLRRTLGGRP